MSIQITQYITRDQAMDRIVEITNLIKEKNYRGLEQVSHETDYDLQDFVDNWIPIDITNINNWTDKLIRSVCKGKDLLDILIKQQEKLHAEIVRSAKEYSNTTKELCECAFINPSINECANEIETFIPMLEDLYNIIHEIGPMFQWY